MMRDNEYAPLYERYVLNPKPDADSDKGGITLNIYQN